MSSESLPPLPPPSTLPYATSARSNDRLFWDLFRTGMILWSATILVRHASFWSGVDFPGLTRAVCLAAAEIVVFLLLLVVSLRAERRAPGSSTLRLLGALSGLYLAINLTGFVVETLEVHPGAIRVLWLLASRVQIWVMPILAVIAAVRPRGE